MTNHQNRKRWAIDQQKKARIAMAAQLEAEERQKAEAREWNNMFFGNFLALALRGELAV